MDAWDETFRALKHALWEAHSPVELHKRSWDAFCPGVLRDIVGTHNAFAFGSPGKCVEFRFSNVRVMPPSVDTKRGRKPLLPLDAMRNFQSYTNRVVFDETRTVRIDLAKHKPISSMMGDVLGDIVTTPDGGREQVIVDTVHDVPWFDLPAMVGTRFCNLAHTHDPRMDKHDRGGYFVINGQPKILMLPEREGWNAPVTSVFHTPAGQVDRVSVRIFPVHESKLRSTSTMSVMCSPIKEGSVDICCALAYPKKAKVGPFALFRLLLAEDCITVDLVMRFIFPHSASHTHMVARLVKAFLAHEERRLRDTTWVQLMIDLDPTSVPATKKQTKTTTTTTDDAKHTDAVLEDHAKLLFQRHLAQELLPHVGIRGSRNECVAKAHVLGTMLRRAVCAALKPTYGVPDHVAPSDAMKTDRCDLRYLRFATALDTIGVFVRQLWDDFHNKALRKQADTILQKHTLTPLRDAAVASKSAAAAVCKAVAKGSFNQKACTPTNQGIGRALKISVFTEFMTMFGLTITPSAPGSERPKKRALHPSHWGRLCSVFTTENANIGLLRAFAMFSRIRLGTPTMELLHTVLAALPPLDPTSLPPLMPDPGTDVPPMLFINHRPVFALPSDLSPRKVFDILRSARRRNMIPVEVGLSVCEDGTGVSVRDLRGSLLRTVLVRDNLHKLPGLVAAYGSNSRALERAAFSHGVLELLDNEEESLHTRTALNLLQLLRQSPHAKHPFTHLEICGTSTLSLVAALVLYLSFNQSPRSMYGTMQLRQAVGNLLTDLIGRFPSSAVSTVFTSRPVVDTDAALEMGVLDHPVGRTLRAAIMLHDGLTSEDACVLSQRAVDLGFGVTTRYTTITVEQDNSNVRSVECRIEHPILAKTRGEEVILSKAKADYSKLDESGVVRIGEHVGFGDVVVGRTLMTSIGAKRDTSKVLGRNEGGIVHDVSDGKRRTEGSSPEGNRLVRIVLRRTVPIHVGDKVTTRHGQKCTVARIVPSEDMPIDMTTGLPIDIIIMPHREPGRMTFGELLEMMAANYAAVDGVFVNGTGFTKPPIDTWRASLARAGWNDSMMAVCDGRSGLSVDRRAFVGLLHLIRLPHFVDLKEYPCRTACLDPITKAPSGGRKNLGAIRMGEMEFDNNNAHGASGITYERQVVSSGGTTLFVCARCGHPDSRGDAWTRRLDTAADRKSLFRPKRQLLCVACSTRSSRMMDGEIGTTASELRVDHGKLGQRGAQPYIENGTEVDLSFLRNLAMDRHAALRKRKTTEPVMVPIVIPFVVNVLRMTMSMMGVELALFPDVPSSTCAAGEEELVALPVGSSAADEEELVALPTTSSAVIDDEEELVALPTTSDADDDDRGEEELVALPTKVDPSGAAESKGVEEEELFAEAFNHAATSVVQGGLVDLMIRATPTGRLELPTAMLKGVTVVAIRDVCVPEQSQSKELTQRALDALGVSCDPRTVKTLGTTWPPPKVVVPLNKGALSAPIQALQGGLSVSGSVPLPGVDGLDSLCEELCPPEPFVIGEARVYPRNPRFVAEFVVASPKDSLPHDMTKNMMRSFAPKTALEPAPRAKPMFIPRSPRRKPRPMEVLSGSAAVDAIVSSMSRRNNQRRTRPKIARGMLAATLVDTSPHFDDPIERELFPIALAFMREAALSSGKDKVPAGQLVLRARFGDVDKPLVNVGSLHSDCGWMFPGQSMPFADALSIETRLDKNPLWVVESPWFTQQDVAVSISSGGVSASHTPATLSKSTVPGCTRSLNTQHYQTRLLEAREVSLESIPTARFMVVQNQPLAPVTTNMLNRGSFIATPYVPGSPMKAGESYTRGHALRYVRARVWGTMTVRVVVSYYGETPRLAEVAATHKMDPRVHIELDYATDPRFTSPQDLTESMAQKIRDLFVYRVSRNSSSEMGRSVRL